MAELRGTVAAFGPVAAGLIVAARKGGAVRLRAGQDIVLVGCVAPAVDHFSLFVERRLLGQVVAAMQLGHVARNDDSLGVLPWPAADAIARIHGRRS